MHLVNTDLFLFFQASPKMYQIRHHSLSAAASRNLSRTLSQHPHLLLGWRAASTDTFVKISGPVTPPQAVFDKDSVVPLEIDNIPAVPDIPVIEALPMNALGEATLESLGLGGWSPPGILQNCLEFLHLDCSLPWWAAIMAGVNYPIHN
jgi:hypothetical protein